MPDLLLVDFGASRVKCVLWSEQRQSVVEAVEVSTPAPIYGPMGEVEVEPDAYWFALQATAGQLLAKYPVVDALWLCTEMHGVIIADIEGVPVTPYISWRDGRGIVKDAFGKSTFNKLEAQGADFFAKCGMKLRPGLPIVSLAHLAAHRTLPTSLRLFTLADWLLWRGGERNPAIHISLAAGTGFLDIHQKTWSTDLFALAGLVHSKVTMADLVPAGKPAGCIVLAGRKIRVFGAIGDLQAAVFGAGFPSHANLAVNLGTGSQVLRAGHNIPLGFERRPGADGRDFAAITHIPSGRALNVFSSFFDDCAKLGGGKSFFWRRFDMLSTEQVLNAKLDVNMNVFAAAWQYERGGYVQYIHEDHFSPDELLAAIAKAWLTQYAAAMESLDPEREDMTFLLSGGLSRRADFVSTVLSSLSGRVALPADTVTGEETLDGLLALARS